MSKENKTISRRFYEEVFSQGNLAVADELLAANCVDHNPPGPGFRPGREGVKQVITMFRSAFPDLQFKIVRGTQRSEQLAGQSGGLLRRRGGVRPSLRVDSLQLLAQQVEHLARQHQRDDVGAHRPAVGQGLVPAQLEAALGRPIAETFIPEFRRRAAERFRSSLLPVPGIRGLLERLERPYCLASSGPLSKIHLTLALTGLLPFFEGRIYSGYEVGAWKPDPGLFLHAANAFGTAPRDCVVVEDSLAGIQAGLAAGVTVCHYHPKAENTPAERGGIITFSSMDQLPALLDL